MGALRSLKQKRLNTGEELLHALDIAAVGLTSIWNVMDLTRPGQGEFHAKVEYPKAA
jgi:hypothetical protein